jgi:hypothetical protein
VAEFQVRRRRRPDAGRGTAGICATSRTGRCTARSQTRQVGPAGCKRGRGEKLLRTADAGFDEGDEPPERILINVERSESPMDFSVVIDTDRLEKRIMDFHPPMK